MFKKFIFGGKKEQKVIENIKKHIKVLCEACNTFKKAIETEDERLIFDISNLEREGDVIRREIISTIHEGAFLPFIRPDLCRFVELLDDALDEINNTARQYMIGLKLNEEIKDDCIQMADINSKMCEMLLFTFESLINGKDLREKILVIRMYEKKIDDMKFNLLKKLVKKDVKNFWEGRLLSDFIFYLTNISNIVEDISDYLQVINVSMR